MKMLLFNHWKTERTSTGPMIVRDQEKEDEILQLMEESGFSKTDGGYYHAK